MLSWKKRLLYPALALFLSLLLAELVLTLVSLVSPRVNYLLSPPWKREVLPDDALGTRMSPYYPGNDRWGYRNAAVPETCAVLTIGDSWTYGYAARPNKSWPRQLEALSGQAVYNMSCGGYGPCEYAVLLDRGLALGPGTVIVGLYIGNDYFDAYRTVYLDGRLQEHRTTDPAVQAALDGADRTATFVERAVQNGGQRREAAPTSAKDWVAGKSALYGLGRAVYQLIAGKQYYSLARDDDPPQDAFDLAAGRPQRVPLNSDPNVRTVFINPALTELFLDVTDPRLREGQRITEEVLRTMQVRLREHGVRFLVVIFPTKPHVYRDLLQAPGASVSAAFASHLDKEDRLVRDLEAFLRQNRIEFVNVAPALRASVQRGERIFPESDDEHPNTNGYRVIAEALLAVLRKDRE